jgi:L-alanine-DL-glutamate epimerase-like enolase superfamily enzyme
MRITDIETHEVAIPFQDFNAETLFRYHGVGIQLRTIYIAKTNTGLEGIGESWGRSYLKPSDLARYIGTDPFDWLGETEHLPIDMALYDLMGKHLEKPAWKLIGPKLRDWVPVGAWTVSQAPDAMAGEVRRAVERGYRWLKYHVDEIQNVIDQTAAMQKVAPPGFKIHYDFNANSNYTNVSPVLRELERFPVAGRIEDPIGVSDRDGWRLLREKLDLPIVVHHGPVEFLVDHCCDGLMAGHAAVGAAAKIAAIAEAVNLPIMLQQCGGTINQAFLAHEAAVFKMATMEHVNLAHLWKDDVTVETMPVVGGSVQVPQGPGLGITLDRDKLERYEKAPRPQYQRFLVRTRYGGGLTVYCRHDADQPGCSDSLRFVERLHRPGAPGPTPGYGNQVVSDFWDETTSPEFERIWKLAESGPVAIPDLGRGKETGR